WSIEDLSGVLGMSRTQLFRKTKQLMGYAPLDLIRHMRLCKAQQLLQQTDDTIQQIAYATGFATPSYFAKCYKVEFGHTPNEENRKK
ncbi:MAG: helix-turn-helix transcriptional regulator, partial [Prevotellaceae bacterium]|nr:helix-turn-helix transcriptional regulator [Candidatus Colivivens equi]